MNHLKYCPECGKPSLQWNAISKFSCSECNFTLYHNVAGAVAVIIKCEDEILLTRRNQNPGIGKLDLAGGFVDPKESAEQTCARELMEELKLSINPDKLKILKTLPNIYHYKDIDYNTLDIFFEYEIDEKPKTKLELNEISEIVWIPKKKINIEDIAFESQKVFFRWYLNQ